MVREDHRGDLRQVDQNPDPQHGDDGDRRADAMQNGGPLRIKQMAPARRLRRRVGMPVLQQVGDDDGRQDPYAHLE
jgi:hypothetical protein